MKNALIRAIARFSPSCGGLDRRILGRLGPYFSLSDNQTKPWISGNGFLMSAKTTNVSYIGGTSERELLKKLEAYLPESGLIINVGANVGYLVLYLAKAAKRKNLSCDFLALEPVPQTYALLKENIELNEFRIEIMNCAAGSSKESGEIYVTGAGDGAASLIARDDPRAKAIEIKIDKLDSLVPYEERKVALIVADVEGFAGEVFQGARQIIELCRPDVCVEIHNNEELSAVTSALGKFNYTRRCLEKGIWGEHYLWTHINKIKENGNS